MGRIVGFEPTRDGATIRCVNHFTIFAIKLAGAVGIEPTLTVLETGVLPLYDAPIDLLYYYSKFFKIMQAFNNLKNYNKIYSFSNICLKIVLLFIIYPTTVAKKIFIISIMIKGIIVIAIDSFNLMLL